MLLLTFEKTHGLTLPNKHDRAPVTRVTLCHDRAREHQKARVTVRGWGEQAHRAQSTQKQKSATRNPVTRAQRRDPHLRLFYWEGQRQAGRGRPSFPQAVRTPPPRRPSWIRCSALTSPKARRGRDRYSRGLGIAERVARDTDVQKARRVLAPGCRPSHAGSAAAAMAAKTARRMGQAQSGVRGGSEAATAHVRPALPRLAPPLGRRNRKQVGLQSQRRGQTCEKITPK